MRSLSSATHWKGGVLGHALEGRRPRRPSVDDVDVVIPVIRGREQPMQQHSFNTI